MRIHYYLFLLSFIKRENFKNEDCFSEFMYINVNYRKTWQMLYKFPPHLLKPMSGFRSLISYILHLKSEKLISVEAARRKQFE